MFDCCPRFRLASPLVLFLALGLVACADEVTSQEPAPSAPSSTSSATDETLAVIDGVAITRADLEAAIGDQLSTLEYQYGSQLYSLLDAGLREVVRERLMDAEAAARGVTLEELMSSEIDAKVSVTEADVEAWYVANQARLQGRPLAALRVPIRQFLVDEQRDRLLGEFTDGLADGREVEILLEPYRVDFDNDNHPAYGPADAPVTVVEFSDFECPYCSGFTTTLDQLKAEYEGKVRLVYWQLPLSQIHANAQKAAEASLCAEDQNMFWELHDAMFAEQSMLSVADLKRKAGRLGLDQATFDACLDSGEHAPRVAADVRMAERLGISGTPAVFVNGRPVEGGAIPLDMLVEIVEDELARSGR
jgi:protein-disulfide isomerase